MKAYCVFDDFPVSAQRTLTDNGIELTLNPKGEPRPEGEALKAIVEEYDIIIISTAQKISEGMLEGITSPKIIATASIGTDHIRVPADRKELMRVVNAPKANRITVAEHTFGLILTLKKQLIEAREAAAKGRSKKTMAGKPHDLYGSTIGVVGAGGIAGAILDMAKAFGMKRLSWTLHPENHGDMSADGVGFVTLDELAERSDIIAVSIPLTDKTKGLISRELISKIKSGAVFISTSRTEVTDNAALFERAAEGEISVGMDVDADKVAGLWSQDMKNVIITPHIAGGTVESRIRLFDEVSGNIAAIKNTDYKTAQESAKGANK